MKLNCLHGRIAALMALAMLVSACAPEPGAPTATQTPYIIVYTATPHSADGPIQPEATTAPATESAPTDTPQPGMPVTPSEPVTLTATPQPPTPTPQPAVPTQPPPNLLTNPGFEGSGRVWNDKGDVVVADGWEPFACANTRPWDLQCYASRIGIDTNNPDGLFMDRPVYFPTTEGRRVRRGGSAQAWACPSRTCRGGVYQTVATEPGSVCEAGVYVQSWSAMQVGPLSDLRTTDDQLSSTWYVRVDPAGGTDPYSTRLRVSRPYGYADGVYDQYVKISTTFTAEGDQATVFFENFRLWPLPHNESFVDDAFVYCSPPAEGAFPPPDPLDRIELGEFGVIADGLPWPASNLGDILQVGDQWWMYYAQMVNRAPVIWRAISTDGVAWLHDPAPVLQIARAPSGGAPEVRVYGLSVTYDEAEGTFRMWRVESWFDDGFAHQFAAASSTDGITWRGAPADIPGGAPGAWNEERIDGVEVVQTGQGYRLFHGGSQLQPTIIRQIGCYTSPDASVWTACANPIFAPRPDLAPFEGVETEQPRVIYHDGVYLMAYTGYLGPQGPRFGIGLAASLDGEHWRRLFDEPVIPLEGEVRTTTAPTLIYDAEGKALWLYYMRDDRMMSIAVAPLEID